MYIMPHTNTRKHRKGSKKMMKGGEGSFLDSVLKSVTGVVTKSTDATQAPTTVVPAADATGVPAATEAPTDATDVTGVPTTVVPAGADATTGADADAEEKSNPSGGKNRKTKKQRKSKKRKSAKKTSAWTKFVTQFYKNEKKKNPSYMFKDALKGAAKVYKK